VTSRFATSPPTPKRAAVQAQLLRAAADVLDEGISYADLSIERITRRAGLSRTAFYFYFADKRELLMALAQEVSARFYAQAERWFSGDGSTPDEISVALANICALYDAHGAVVRVVVEATTSDEQIGALWRLLMSQFVGAARARIEQEQQAGRARPGPAGELAFALCWMSERALYEHHFQPDTGSREELVEALTAIWTRSIYG
jgi:AcrR family transcriptional regulator